MHSHMRMQVLKSQVNKTKRAISSSCSSSGVKEVQDVGRM